MKMMWNLLIWTCRDFYLTHRKVANEESLLYSWQQTLAGSDEEPNPPRCQSTICIVVLWHFKHLECTLCFGSIQFSTGRNYQSSRQAAVAPGLVTRVCDCEVASLTLGSIWEQLSRGRWVRNTLISTAAEGPICTVVSFQIIQWHFSGNTRQLPTERGCCCAWIYFNYSTTLNGKQISGTHLHILWGGGVVSLCLISIYG